MMNVPYFSQWESPAFASAILSKSFDLSNDPLWENSGASSRDEYALWANHICGMACLKMILAARRNQIYPTLALARIATEYGAYQFDGTVIKGLIYAPFVSMVVEKFDVSATVMTAFPAGDIHRHLKQDGFFMASVHPTIRWPTIMPPQTGGHLVLVTRVEQDEVIFHNPSGDTVQSRENVRLSVEQFSRYYAERGILF